MELLRHLFIDLKIRTKLTISYIVIIVFTILLISVLVFKVSDSVILSNTKMQTQYLVSQVSENLSARFTALEEFQFSQYQYSILGSLLAAIPADETERGNKHRQIINCLGPIVYSRPYIKGIIAVDNRGEVYSLSADGGEFAGASELIAETDIPAIVALRGKGAWSMGKNGLFIMKRSLININDTRQVGAIMLLIDPAYIAEVYENSDLNKFGNILILDNSGNILPPASESLENLVDYQLSLPNAASRTVKYEGEEYNITQTELAANGFTLLNIVSLRDLSIYTGSLPLYMAAAGLASIFLAMIFARLVAVMVTGNVKTLVNGIRDFANGQLSSPIVVKSRDEIGFLAEEFNKMAQEINNLIEDVYNADLRQKNAEIKALQFEYSALQSKVNPHFLYNTLESVNSLAKIKGDAEISEIIVLLGSLLRDSINPTIDIITLKQELAYIHTYLRIQKLSYGDKFNIEIAIDEKLDGAVVPKFILQPLVENAILHGIQPMLGKGKIVISCFGDDNCLNIKISDNGMGMSKGELERLLDYSAPDPADNGSHTRVGVRSVDKRIKILYGGEYGLKIQSEIGNGTDILVTMPLKLELTI